MAATSALTSLSSCAPCDLGGRRSEGGLIGGACGPMETAAATIPLPSRPS
eukprot:CAMPEP_0117563158 /NCGR_PEP_ID=MMETSP0784-20121206/55345_1 /TAXON_ID=39447 /ORGANISM="" /LENGTH=49 /DNA_ID= /DNA_START= /DNA_END= /DNA_ORIENTATION=